MDNKMDNKELISALADGQLQGEVFAQAVQTACADRSALADWHAYHLIGDVLRSGDAARAARSAAVPGEAHCAPRAGAVPAAGGGAHRRAIAVVGRGGRQRRQHALEAAGRRCLHGCRRRGRLVGRRRGLRRRCSRNWPPRRSSAAPGAVLARSDGGVMIRDARLDELLAAHRQLGGASALQMPAGFLRNATFEGPAR